MTVRYLDPRGEPARVPEAYELGARLGSTDQIGLLANGFPDSVAFLETVGRALVAERPELRVRLWDKGDASRVASDEMLDAIVAESRAVVAAYGH